MGMSVVPEESRRVIARNLDRIMQNLARHGHHSEHIILGRIGRNGQPVEMQVRHIHARVHCAVLWRSPRKIVDIGDPENVTWGSADYGSHLLILESEGIPAIFIHCMQRKRYYVVPRLHLRRLRPSNSSDAAQRYEKYPGCNEEERSRHNQGNSATCQPESRWCDIICGATVCVFGPRSFSYTTPFCVTRNVMTPEERYFAG